MSGAGFEFIVYRSFRILERVEASGAATFLEFRKVLSRLDRRCLGLFLARLRGTTRQMPKHSFVG